MRIDIPKSVPYRQINDGDIYGSLNTTFNMDFEKFRGQVLPSTRVTLTDTSTDIACAFAGDWTSTVNGLSSKRYWTVNGSQVQQTSSVFGTWSNDSASGGPSNLDPESADIIIFNDLLWVVGDTSTQNIYNRTATGTWTEVTSYSVGGAGSSLGLDPLCLVDYADRLYIAGRAGKRIYSLATPYTTVTNDGSYTFDLAGTSQGTLEITCARAASDGIWFGTLNTSSGRASMFKWDGVTENTADASYKIDAKAVLAMTIKDDRPYIITSKGSLQTFNGSFFEEIAQLPMEDERLINFDGTDGDRFIHRNGMAVIDEQIHILVNNRPEDTNSNYSNKLQSGVYVYDEEVGLVHKHSLCRTNSGTISDYGMPELLEVGAIFPVIQGQNADYDEYSNFMCGAGYYTDDSTTSYGVFVHTYDDNNIDLGAIQREGHFVTQKILSGDLSDIWQEVGIAYDSMDNSTDKIKVKYSTNPNPTRVTFTWVADDQMTTTSDLSAYEVGDEVFIKRGFGSGKSLTITTLKTIDGGYKITVDEPLSGATGTGIANVQAWKEVININDTVNDFERQGISKNASRIQFKTILEGKGDNPKLNRLIIVSDSNESTN